MRGAEDAAGDGIYNHTRDPRNAVQTAQQLPATFLSVPQMCVQHRWPTGVEMRGRGGLQDLHACCQSVSRLPTPARVVSYPRTSAICHETTEGNAPASALVPDSGKLDLSVAGQFIRLLLSPLTLSE